MGYALRNDTVIENAVISDLELGASMGDLSKLEFRGCLFSRVELDVAADVVALPNFRDCYIEFLEGRVSRADLPADKMGVDCEIENFVESAATTAAVLALDLSLGKRVCLTVLKKIYERRGAGRRENALYRGLDHRARRIVPRVLQVLQSENLAFPYKRKADRIWLPGRDRRRVGRIIAAPSTVRDRVLDRCEDLGE